MSNTYDYPEGADVDGAPWREDDPEPTECRDCGKRIHDDSALCPSCQKLEDEELALND